MPLHLEFLNKNLYRKYPFRSGSSMKTSLGIDIPQDLLAGASITTGAGATDVYISKIYCKGGFLNLTISTSEGVLGCFSGKVVNNYQSLLFTPFIKQVSGFMLAGTPEAVASMEGTHYVDSANGRLEDSLVFSFTPPGVTAINHEAQRVTGDVTIAGTNITITNAENDLGLAVIDKSKITSNNDANAYCGTCPTPSIKLINTVPPDGSGNIDVIGIAPVVITVESGKLLITLGDLTLDTFCPQDKLAPDNPSGTYPEFLTAEDPEWKSW